MGNGHCLVSEGQIKSLEIFIQDHIICLPVFLLLITGFDLVLGAAWLDTIGPHVADYSTTTIKFYLNGQFVTLHGEPPQGPLMTSITLSE